MITTIPRWSLLVASLVLPSVCLSQSVSDATDGITPASLTLNLNVSVGSSITLELTGNSIDPFTSLTTILQGIGADVEFGTVDTLCVSVPLTGACHRLTDDTGARLVATIDARVQFTGFTSFDLGIQAPLVAGVNRNLFTVCGGDGSCPTNAVDTFWKNPGTGVLIPTVSSGVELVASGVSGIITEHQLAMELLDVSASGNLSLPVTYSASANP